MNYVVRLFVHETEGTAWGEWSGEASSIEDAVAQANAAWSITAAPANAVYELTPETQETVRYRAVYSLEPQE